MSDSMIALLIRAMFWMVRGMWAGGQNGSVSLQGEAESALWQLANEADELATLKEADDE